MDTKAQLQNALRNAMRAGDEVTKRTLRMALSTIQLAEVEKGGPLPESAVTAILQKEVKSRQETIEEAKRADRPALAASSLEEITVLEAFLPQQLSQEELDILVRQVIKEIGATSPADMGKIMKSLMPRLQGRASGDQASQAVRRVLSQA